MHNSDTQPNTGNATAETHSARLRLFRAVMLKEIKMPAEEFMSLVEMIREGAPAS